MALIAFDLETNGTLPEFALQPWRMKAGEAWITTCAFVTPVNGELIKFGATKPPKDKLAEFLTYALKTRSTILGWNVTFDIAWLLAAGLEDLVFANQWIDGMRLWRHLDISPEYDRSVGSKRSYKLKPDAARAFAPEYLGYEEGVDFQASDPAALMRLLDYNVRDCELTLIATQKIWGALSPEQRDCALIEAACFPHVARANLNGMRVDMGLLEVRDEELRDKALAYTRELANDGVTAQMVRSNKQLSKLLFDEWALPDVSGKRSTNKAALYFLSHQDPRALRIREFRETLNLRSKFISSIARSVHYNNAQNVTHPEAIVFGTYTSRMTYASKQGKNKDTRYTGFALHQMKRGPTYRALIRPPEGYALIEFDAAGQEYRWMAIASGDPTMLSLCRPGEDPHSYMGAAIRHMDYREVQRRSKDKSDLEIAGPHGVRMFGKLGNLSLQYRTSARKLLIVARVDYDIPMTEAESRHTWETYRLTYPGVEQYWRDAIRRAQEKGYAETFGHRRVAVVGDWTGKLAWSMESTAINYPIQGTGGDQKYLALSVLHPYLLRHGVVFAWDLHDGLYFYAPLATAERNARDMKIVLDNLPYKRAWGFEPPIPMPWDAKVGDSWGSLKELQC